MELKFHLDEGVAHAVSNGLRLRDIDVTTSTEAGLLGVADQEQLAHATRAGRVLVTHDRDFLRLAAQVTDHPGIAYCPPERRSIGQIVMRLMHLWRSKTADEMLGVVEYL